MATILSLNIWNCQIFCLHLHNKFSTTMLTKKDKKKRYNKKAKTFSTHVFDAWGDRYDSKFMKNSANTAQEAFSGSNLGGSIAGIAGGIGGIVEAGMANAQIADTTEQEQEREARENWQSSANDNNRASANNSPFNENPFDGMEPPMDTTSVDNDPFASFGEKVEISDNELPF